MSTIQWSPQQAQAIDAAAKWLRDPSAPQVFKIFGFAGTGKTSIATHLVSEYGPRAKFAAFTGKAALRMRTKGCHGATTLHSLIYKVEEDDHGNRSFNINVESPLTSAHVLVLDECSMLSKEIAQDALSFGTKVLVLGDPGQLPPIDGAGYFNVGKPDVLLTEIHRQAADSPILHLATLARKGQRIPPGQYGNCTVVGRVKVDKDFMGQEVVQADQVLVGKNATRHLYNNRIRELKGLRGDIEGWHPTAGDKLICLRNDHKKGYLNGALWLVDRVNTVEEDRLSLRLSSLDDFSSAGDDEPAAVAYPYVPAQFFNGTEDTVNRWVRKSLDEFCFGWAMTVHKAQGSEFNHLVVFDESAIFREDASRHRYTAITRASEKLTLVL